MRVSSTTTAPRVEQDQYSRYKQIKLYGKGNDYPQKVIYITQSSGTGEVCFKIYSKFIEGNGFADKILNGTIVNRKGETAGKLLHKCAADLRMFDGFALLVKYNGMLQADEHYHIPFEQCRLEINDKKEYTGRVAVHPDWNTKSGKAFDSVEIKYINQYNPKNVLAEIQSAGSPFAYTGQVYYFTMNGDFEYPTCPYDAVITDMLTEESVSTVKYRNAKHNFLPSGVLVRKGIKPKTNADGTIDENDPLYLQQKASADELKRLQGDENSCKIWVTDIDSDEEKPEFIDFNAKNYDRQYEVTEKTVQENIGRMSMIPPILRGIDIGAGFGATLMQEAYAFMNSITTSERAALSGAFKEVFLPRAVQFADYSIQPLNYISSTP